VYEHAPHSRFSLSRLGGRHRAAAVVTAVAAVTVTVGALAPTSAFAGGRPDSVQSSLNALVKDDGLPAALATVKGRDGHTRTYTAGVGNLATAAKVPVDGQIRIGT